MMRTIIFYFLYFEELFLSINLFLLIIKYVTCKNANVN